MGQNLSKDKGKGKGKDKGKGKKKKKEGSSSDDTSQYYEIRHPQWVFEDPSSSQFCYSPIRTRERGIQIQITKIMDENQQPYYEKRCSNDPEGKTETMGACVSSLRPKSSGHAGPSALRTRPARPYSTDTVRFTPHPRFSIDSEEGPVVQGGRPVPWPNVSTNF
ncbi:hypothetical protein F5Y06DRAFT_293862 [Hypoxylon sp. FL0890]|nr:hypothetical protein F5Y06DRAFT_293862 [Hypoxylon sp. FL0890]